MKAFIHVSLILAILIPGTIFGQNLSGSKMARPSDERMNWKAFAAEVAPGGSDEDALYAFEAEKMAAVLVRSRSMNPVFIDENGFDREFVLKAVAARLANSGSPKRIFKVNWPALLSLDSGGPATAAGVRAVINAAENSKSSVVLFLDDLTGLSKSTPYFGTAAAEQLYAAVAAGRIQVVAAGTSSDFDRMIAGDSRLNPRFKKIQARHDSDPFVGDRLSPDLREMLGNSDPNTRVKVILQADDIANAALMTALAKNGVTVESKANNLGMLTVEMPLGAAEAISAVRGTQHLSLDREVSLLGHIETTTGVSLVRTISQGLNVSLLGTGVANTSEELDGRGIGIAIVDSSIREDHRSFVDVNNQGRVAARKSFFGGGNSTNDQYGHGTHVASLAAGGDGANLNLADGTYLENYKGIAPKAKIINLRVLDDHGIGNAAALISALDWLLANRTTYNIRVVNSASGHLRSKPGEMILCAGPSAS